MLQLWDLLTNLLSINYYYLHAEYPFLRSHDIVQLPVRYPRVICLLPLLQQEIFLNSAALCPGTQRH